MGKKYDDITAEERRFVLLQMADWVKYRDCYAAFVTEFGGLTPGKEDYDRAKSKLDYFYNHPSAKKFRAEAMELRATLIADMSDLPIFHKRYRLRQLARLYDSADSKTEARKVLTQAQKEVEGIEGNAGLNDAKTQALLNLISGLDDKEDE